MIDTDSNQYPWTSIFLAGKLTLTPYTLNMTIKFDHPVNVFVLQIGGWIPLAFCTSSALMLDRNILGVLKQLHRTPDDPTLVSKRWWLEFLNSNQYSLSPVLAAVEGTNCRFPTFTEFTDEIADAAGIIARTLPNARVIQLDQAAVEALYEMFRHKLDRAAQESAFLIKVAPLLSNRVARSRLRETEDALYEVAVSQGLKRATFVVVAALSCLYEPDNGSTMLIGRGVIKPTPTYSETDAHNAVADLRALEFLAAANGLVDTSCGLCTRDRSLVGLWVGLNVRSGDPTARPYSVTSEPMHVLFPRLPEEDMQNLVARIKE